MIDLVFALLIVWILAYPAVDYYVRLFASGVIRKGNTREKMIHLTFDDGPDPENTVPLLAILKAEKIPATFFLVGKKAEQHREIVAEILSEGHEVGIHTYYHQHAYLMPVGKSIETVKEGKQILEDICQKPLVWFRPPWGALSFFQYLTVKRLGLKVVLWTANAIDWKKATGSGGICRRLRKRVKPGTIIVLHDSGGEPGAPRNTLTALPQMIDYFKKQGFKFVTLTEIIGGHNGWK